MRKVLLIIGIFGVLSVGMFISGCGDDGLKECKCTSTIAGPNPQGIENRTYTTTVDEDKHCSDVLNGVFPIGNDGTTETVNCVGVN